MKDEIKLRKAMPSDIETISNIAVLAWEPIYAAYLEDMGKDLFELMLPGWREEKARQVRAKSEEQPDEVYVSEINGKIVGFTTFNIDTEKKIGEICNNAVLPEFQGRGIGKMQHRKILDIFREKGLRYAIVTTGLDKGHANARASYEKIGFKRMKWSVTYFQELQ